MPGRLEARLRMRFAVREDRFAHRGWEVELVLPRAADELIDEAEFASDERLPYWAELWPSGRALARYLLDLDADWTNVRALELGCGVALPSLALRSRGVEVLATDWYEDALRFARANAERNGLGPLRTEVLDWRAPPGRRAYGLVIAADVLYERRNGSLLAALLRRVAAPDATVLVADPGRVYAGDFLRLVREGGWRVNEAAVIAESSAPGAESRVRIHRLRRGAGSRAEPPPLA